MNFEPAKIKYVIVYFTKYTGLNLPNINDWLIVVLTNKYIDDKMIAVLAKLIHKFQSKCTISLTADLQIYKYSSQEKKNLFWGIWKVDIKYNVV